MITLSEMPGRITTINGFEYLFFSGYSYLGLGNHDEYKSLVKEGIDKFGVVYPSSRISNTPLDLYETVEHRLAALTHTEQAAVFSSGFLSARTVAEVMCSNRKVYAKVGTHPASSGLSSVTPITQSWDEFLEEREQEQEFEFGIVADSFDTTPGHIYDFSFLKQTPARFNITLAIDDSHGIGWMGPEGEGIASRLQLPPNIDLILHFSLSKAYHLNAGAVCASSAWIRKIKEHVNFTSSTPMMPALAYAWINASHIYREQRSVLANNIEYLQKQTASFTFAHNEGTPVFKIELKDIAPYLLQNNIIISSFGYPHPEDDTINRVVVNALHLKSDFDKLTQTLKRFN